MVSLHTYGSLGIACLCLLVCVGNALTLAAIFKYRTLQTKCNFLVAHLAVVDFITGLTTWPVLRFLAVDGASQASCLFGHAIVTGLKFASLLFLFEICIVMYVKIVYPLRSQYLASKRRLKIMSLLVWLISVVIGGLCLIWQPPNKSEAIVSQCFMTLIPFPFWIGALNVPYVVISTSILVIYVRVLRIARGHLQRTRIQDGDSASTTSLRRLIVMDGDESRHMSLTSGASISTIPTISRDVQRCQSGIVEKREQNDAADKNFIISRMFSFNRKQIKFNFEIRTDSIKRPKATKQHDRPCSSEDTSIELLANNALSTDTHQRRASSFDSSFENSGRKILANSSMSSETYLMMHRNSSRRPSVINSLTMSCFREDLHVTLTMVIAFLAFLICWLPLEIAIYLTYAGLINSQSPFVELALMLSLANSAVNVFIYSWRYGTFRRAIYCLLTCRNEMIFK